MSKFKGLYMTLIWMCCYLLSSKGSKQELTFHVVHLDSDLVVCLFQFLSTTRNFLFSSV